MPEFLNNAINTHQYPKIYARIPILLKLHHFITAAITLRVWYVRSTIAKILKEAKKPFIFIDAGSGGGDIILPLAKKYPNSTFIGIDHNRGNIDLCSAVALKKNIDHCTFVDGDLEKSFFTEKADFIACITVLQYIKSDEILLTQFRNALKPGGRLFIYVSTENKRYFRWYRRLLGRISANSMYDQTQGMVRVYSAKEIREKLNKCGFKIEKETISYGSFGKMAYELYQTGIFALKKFPLLPAFIFLLFFIIAVYPVILILMIIDFVKINQEGNGLLLIATANENPGN